MPPHTQRGSRSAAGSAPLPQCQAQDWWPSRSSRTPPQGFRRLLAHTASPMPTFFSSRTLSAKNSGLLDHAPGGCKLYFLKLRQPPPHPHPAPTGKASRAWPDSSRDKREAGGALERRPPPFQLRNQPPAQGGTPPRIRVFPPARRPPCHSVVSSGQEAGKHRRCLRETAHCGREPGGQQSPRR